MTGCKRFSREAGGRGGGAGCEDSAPGVRRGLISADDVCVLTCLASHLSPSFFSVCFSPADCFANKNYAERWTSLNILFFLFPFSISGVEEYMLIGTHVSSIIYYHFVREKGWVSETLQNYLITFRFQRAANLLLWIYIQTHLLQQQWEPTKIPV